jgi:hypothetical protein
MNRSQKETVYGTVSSLAVAALGLSAFALTYAQMWIQQYNRAPWRLVPRFSEWPSEQVGMMQNIRLAGGVALAVSAVLVLLSGRAYLKACDNPRFQLKIMTATGVLALVAGGAVQFMLSQLPWQSLGLSLIGFGGSLGGLSILYLAVASPSDRDTDSGPQPRPGRQETRGSRKPDRQDTPGTRPSRDRQHTSRKSQPQTSPDAGGSRGQHTDSTPGPQTGPDTPASQTQPRVDGTQGQTGAPDDTGVSQTTGGGGDGLPCPNCGHTLGDVYNYCSKCGTEV